MYIKIYLVEEKTRKEEGKEEKKSTKGQERHKETEEIRKNRNRVFWLKHLKKNKFFIYVVCFPINNSAFHAFLFNPRNATMADKTTTPAADAQPEPTEKKKPRQIEHTRMMSRTNGRGESKFVLLTSIFFLDSQPSRFSFSHLFLVKCAHGCGRPARYKCMEKVCAFKVLCEECEPVHPEGHALRN